jgi:hypothetical protein
LIFVAVMSGRQAVLVYGVELLFFVAKNGSRQC